MRNERGVVLLYVLILIMILGYVSSLLLKASLSRRISAKVVMDSNEIRADMASINGRIHSAITLFNRENPSRAWPGPTSCANPPPPSPTGDLQPWLGAKTGWQISNGASDPLPPRLYRFTICTNSAPPCPIQIKVCRPNLEDPNEDTCSDPPAC